MGKGLHRIGSYIFAHPWRFVLLWLVIVGVSVGVGMNIGRPMSESITIPGTQGQVALDRLKELFPNAGAGTGRVVFETSDGTSVEKHKAAITAALDTIKKVDGVSQVVSPFEYQDAITKDGTIAYAQVQLKQQAGQINKKTLEDIAHAVESSQKDGLSAHMAGDLINNAPGEILGVGEAVGVLIALMVLIITFGSLVAAGLPIVVALIAVAASMGALLAVGHWLEISSTSPVMAVMLGLAVGIDYSLFIVSKYRSLRISGVPAREAIGRANGTAGNAVVFAATTVVIALSALSVVGIPFMTIMGLAGAGTVAVAAIVAITLLPALLGIVGDKVFGKKARRNIVAAKSAGVRATKRSATNAKPAKTRRKFGERWVNFVVAHPWLTIVGSVAIVAAIAWPAAQIKLGIPTDQYAAPTSSERKAYDAISRGFGEGYNAPLAVVVEHLPKVNDETKQEVRQQLRPQFDARVKAEQQAAEKAFAEKAAAASTPEEMAALQQQIQQAQEQAPKRLAEAEAQFNQAVERYAKLYRLNQIGERLQQQYGSIAKVVPAVVNDDATAGVLQVIPNLSPTSQETKDLIHWLRSSDATAAAKQDGISLAVTGSTAMEADINQKLAEALPVYLVVVVGLSLVILMIAFRSILVPLKATLGFLLSVGAMFGAIVMAFQWGWFGITDAPAPIVSFIPIIGIGILFGLAMDYEFFLVSNMHEAYAHSKKPNAKEAVRHGFVAGAKVVTAAAVIMVAVFAGFVTNHNTTVQAIGFGLAVGILVDAFVVRMTLVPAIMAVLGKSAWWLPKWLDKLLPRVSIEGEEE